MACVRLLIVDDNDFFVRSILPPLQMDEQLEIVGAVASGQDALALVADLHPDVVLLDLNMSGLHGLAVTAHLNRQPHAPKILILSGADDAHSAQGAFAAGVRGYLRKDQISDDLLVSAIFAVAHGGVFVDMQTFAILFPF
jgi:DNA-binding NarL/FixJ family response regulator